jgi:hypothetical protein
MDFAREVLDVCDAVGVDPILDGSLTVFAYTREANMDVRDVDLNCPEPEFPRLLESLRGRGIRAEITGLHVLQARRDGLKVEFGAIEHWMRDIPINHKPVRIAGIEVRIVTLDGLREQYRRGAENTAEGAVDVDPAKHQASSEKLRLLDALHTRLDLTSNRP